MNREIAKLQKKRGEIIKQISKHKAKSVHLLSPSHAQPDVASALTTLFPTPVAPLMPQVHTHDATMEPPSTFISHPLKSDPYEILSNAPNPPESDLDRSSSGHSLSTSASLQSMSTFDTSVDDSVTPWREGGEDGGRVSLWEASAQRSNDDSLCAVSPSYFSAVVKRRMEWESVSASVRRVFPQWEENLEYIQHQVLSVLSLLLPHVTYSYDRILNH